MYHHMFCQIDLQNYLFSIIHWNCTHSLALILFRQKDQQYLYHNISIILPHLVGLLLSMTASHVVGHRFAPQSGHTKDHHKMVQTLPCISCMHYGRSLTVQPNCLKGRVVYGTVYNDMHFKDLLGSITRVG